MIRAVCHRGPTVYTDYWYLIPETLHSYGHHTLIKYALCNEYDPWCHYENRGILNGRNVKYGEH